MNRKNAASEKSDSKKSTEASGNVSDAGTQTLYEIISGDDWNRF